MRILHVIQFKLGRRASQEKNINEKMCFSHGFYSRRFVPGEGRRQDEYKKKIGEMFIMI